MALVQHVAGDAMNARKVDAPAPREYSMKPGAIRSRRFRERLAAKVQLEQEKGPITSWACGCGYRLRLRGTFAETVRQFEAHGPCLFTGGAQIVQINVVPGKPRMVPR